MRLNGLWSRIVGRKAKKALKGKAARRDNVRLAIEGLEERVVMTALPAPQTGTVADFADRAHSPIVAADPLNPQRLVAVYVTQDNTVDRRWNTIGLAYSTNAGQTWSLTSALRAEAGAGARHDPSTYNVGNGQTTPFTTASTPSVCWDAQGNFYVVALQHNATYKSGQLVMSKFRFTGTVPTAVFTNQVLQTWYDNEPIYNPVVAIDNNVPALRGNDSPSAVNVLDTMVNKAVYVAWNTRTKDGTTPTQGAFLDVDGPHGIRVMASSDGGLSFTTPVFVNDYDPDPLNPNVPYDAGPTDLVVSAPQIIFTQGTHDGDLNSGEMLIAYSAASGVRVSSSQPDEGKATNRVADAIAYAWSQANDPGNNSTIRDAATVTGSNPRFDTVTVTDFTIPVTEAMLPDKTFGSVVDLDVSLSLLHADVRQLQIELVFNQRDEFGVLTGLTRSIILVDNRLTNSNQDRGSWVGFPNNADRLGVIDIGSASAVPNQIGGPLYNNVDLIFDQQANLQINHAASSPTYIARFRPEGTGYNSTSTNSINSLIAGLSGADLTGDWVLRVTDHWDQDGNPAANPTNYGQGNRLLDFGLQFSSHIDMDHFGTEDINTTAGTVANSPTNVYATHPTSPSNGIAPTVRFAQDTSVGGFSPYQGRIYMVYVAGNDIYLKASDDNGVNWDAIGGAAERVKVNDDSNLDEIMSTGGRAQFTPAIAVDPVTSTVVVTFYDGRYDASGTRVATYMAVSGDGGETFSPNVFLNEARDAFDMISRDMVTIEPVPSNQAQANTGTAGFGWQMGLYAYDGKAMPVWAGNVNNVIDRGNNWGPVGSRLFTNVTSYTNGPRIIHGDMGTVAQPFYDPSGRLKYNNSFATDGTRQLDSFVVQFDRPIDVASFDIGDVTLIYRSPYTASTNPGEVIPVSSIVVVDDDPLLDTYGPRQLTYDDNNLATTFRIFLTTPEARVGTYSYSIEPTLEDKLVRPNAPVTGIGSQQVTNTTDVTIPDAAAATSVISVAAGPNERIGDVKVSVNISHNVVSDLLLELIHPDGTIVQLANRRGGSTVPNINAIFDDAAANPASTATDLQGPYQPDWLLSSLDLKAINGDWTLRVTDLQGNGEAGIINSWSLDFETAAFGTGGTIDEDTPAATTTFTIPMLTAGTAQNVSVELLIDHNSISDLLIELEAPDGTRRILANQAGDNSLADAYVRFEQNPAYPLVTNAAALIGPNGEQVFLRPEQSLNAFNGESWLPFQSWKLHITDMIANGATGSLTGWRLNFDRDDTGTFNDTPVAIPDASTSSINVVPINAEDVVAAGTTVTVNVTHPHASDLLLELQGPDGTRITLVNRQGGASILNTTNITFSDAANNSVIGATALNGQRRPEQALANFIGKPMAGTWTLYATDLGGGDVGVINSWTIDFQRGTLNPHLAVGNKMDQDADGTEGEGVATGHTASGATITGIGTPITSNINLSGFAGAEVKGVEVTVNITHPQVSDLLLELVSPTGTVVTLANQRGGATANVGTTFRDAADGSVTTALTLDGVAYLSPESLLSVLNGESVNGNWQLRVTDQVSGAVGTLDNWSILVNTDANPDDVFAIPKPTGGTPFVLPYEKDTLPLIIPGPHVVNTSLPGENAGTGIYTYEAPTGVLPIPDADFFGPGQVTEDIVVSGTGKTIASMQVYVNISHTWVSDLNVVLIGPDGTIVPLTLGNGGDSDNILATFWDSAIADVGNTRPIRGLLIPDGALTDFQGKQIDGTWRLRVRDTSIGEVGTLNDWRLEFTAENMALNDTVSGVDVTFDRDIDPTTFTPEDVIRILGPLGPVTGPFSWSGLTPIADNNAANPLIMPINVTATGVVQAGMSVKVNLTHPSTRDLRLELISPDGTILQLLRGKGAADDLNGNNNTFDLTFSDAAAATAGATALGGVVKPDQSFNAFLGRGVTGTWKLRVTDEVTGKTGFINSWSINFNQNIRVTQLSPTDFRKFRVEFPQQALNGYYTVQLGSDIEARNARHRSSGAVVITDATQTTPTAPVVTTPVTSVINVAQTGAVQAGMTVSVDITHARPGDLRIELISASGTVIPLALRRGGSSPNVLATFSDTAALSVVNAVTLSGQLRPEGTLGGLIGETIAGNWTLRVTDMVKGTAGTINGWAISFLPERLDSDLDAGLDVLRGADPANGSLVNNTFQASPTTAITIPANSTVTATLNVNDAFLIRKAVVFFDLIHARARDLGLTLIAPDGTRVKLFDGVGANGPISPRTTLDDQLGITAITLAATPYSGTYKPQNPLGVLLNHGSAGQWKLEIVNRSTSEAGTLTDWGVTLTESTATTGLGETNADNYTVPFRIFTQDPTNALSGQQWTAVGPIANNNQHNAGAVSAIAIDPSDSSGNTVYLATPSSGVWKTTNYLTKDLNGPTWLPLTDFGSTRGVSISSIALLPRNNDPAQTVVIAATGDATGTAPFAQIGIGFLRSEDGGASWKVIDSLSNFEADGDYRPLSDPLRNGEFRNKTTYKVTFDPNRLSNGHYIVYAAVGSANGGIYKSMDSGRNWEKVGTVQGTGAPLSGNATDISLVTQRVGVAGTLNEMYAGIQGQGVYRSINGGTTWTLLTGLTGLPQIQRTEGTPNDPHDPVPVNNNTAANTPVGNQGRILLATAARQDSFFQDRFYGDWVYAVTTSATGGEGLYVSKDAGRNWTRVLIPMTYFTNLAGQKIGTGGPTNVETVLDANYMTLGADSLAVDPADPRIVYIGTWRGLIRLDLTTLSDTHAFVARDNSDFDPAGGPLQNVTAGGVNSGANGGTGVTDNGDITIFAPDNLPGANNWRGVNVLNMTRHPDDPFAANTTVIVGNVASMVNNGTDFIWQYFVDASDSASTQYYYSVLPVFDPRTGQTRLHLGTYNGVYTAVDDGDGDLSLTVGVDRLINGTRNGNLQIMELSYGGAQTDGLAADLAGALFYASTWDRGFPQSDADILQTGSLVWTEQRTAIRGGGTLVEADPTGTGQLWKFHWPYYNEASTGNGVDTDFLKITDPALALPQSRTNGLFIPGDNPLLGQGQWGQLIGSQMAINPFYKDAMVISSNVAGQARLYRTEDAGENWNIIAGTPTTAGLDGQFAHALAFGAPDPARGPELSNFIYAGTDGGNIFVTFDGGNWVDISAGLDGSRVRQISTNPLRGTYEAYAVTEGGVYYMADSSDPAATWVDISGVGSGNLFNLTAELFNDADQVENILRPLSLNSLIADWRFMYPDDASNPAGPSHPVLYVAGDGGVFRSLDKGVTWTYFPGRDEGAAREGGQLPRINVTDLVLLPGKFISASGEWSPDSAYSMLLATTEGRGAFAIRLSNVPAPGGPRVLDVTPDTDAPMDYVDVTFDIPVDPSTFGPEDIASFKDALGNSITITGVAPVANSDNMVFRVSFAGQVAPGAYTMTIGPNIADFSGRKMNQTNDGVSGDPLTDTYTARFFASGASVPVIVNVTPTGQVHAAYSTGTTFERAFWGVLPKTVTWVNVTSGDFNNDGWSDYAGRVAQTGEWWVSLATSSGWQTSRWATWNPATPYVNVGFADFNGDGRLDLAGQNESTGEWTIGLSSGYAFTSSVWTDWATRTVVVRARPLLTKQVPVWINVQMRDFTGDGSADLAAYDAATGKWWVAASNGRDAFATAVEWGTWARTTWVDIRTGDFNNDGRFDIVGRQSLTGQIHVLTSNGNGFTNALWGTWTRTTWVGVAVADFNNDGNDDLIGRQSLNGSFFVAISNGSSFTTTRWGGLPMAWNVALYGDFTGDGQTDVAARNATTGQLHVLASNGTTFDAAALWGVLPRPTAWQHFAVGDFDNNGFDDIAARNPTTGAITVAQVTQAPVTGVLGFTNTFGTYRLPNAVTWSNYLTGDFNGDGLEDLAARVVQNNQWYVMEANGKTASMSAPWTTWAAGNWVNIVAGDFNADGMTDLAARNAATGHWWVSMSNGSTFDPAQPWTAGTDLWPATRNNRPATYYDVQVADFNNDGRDDIVARQQFLTYLPAARRWVADSQLIAAYANGTAFTVQTVGPVLPRATYNSGLAGDFNGDGRSDYAIRNATNRYWYVAMANPGTDALDGPIATVQWAARPWVDIRVGDFNGDGRDDIIARDNLTRQLWSSEGQAAGTPLGAHTQRTTTPWVAGVYHNVHAVDLDGDGDDDLIGRIFANGNWMAALADGTGSFDPQSPWHANYFPKTLLTSLRLKRG